MESKRQGGSTVGVTTMVLTIVTIVLLAVAFWRGRDLPLIGLLAAGRTLWRNLPMLLLGFAIAGLAQVVIPQDLISRWLGTQARFKGMLISCVVGGLVPGSPYVTSPCGCAISGWG